MAEIAALLADRGHTVERAGALERGGRARAGRGGMLRRRRSSPTRSRDAVERDAGRRRPRPQRPSAARLARARGRPRATGRADGPPPAQLPPVLRDRGRLPRRRRRAFAAAARTRVPGCGCAAAGRSPRRRCTRPGCTAAAAAVRARRPVRRRQRGDRDAAGRARRCPRGRIDDARQLRARGPVREPRARARERAEYALVAGRLVRGEGIRHRDRGLRGPPACRWWSPARAPTSRGCGRLAAAPTCGSRAGVGGRRWPSCARGAARRARSLALGGAVPVRGARRARRRRAGARERPRRAARAGRARGAWCSATHATDWAAALSGAMARPRASGPARSGGRSSWPASASARTGYHEQLHATLWPRIRGRLRRRLRAVVGLYAELR